MLQNESHVFKLDTQFISGTDNFPLQKLFNPFKFLRNYQVSIDRFVTETPNKDQATNGGSSTGKVLKNHYNALCFRTRGTILTNFPGRSLRGVEKVFGGHLLP